jgi:hypothetical protein
MIRLLCACAALLALSGHALEPAKGKVILTIQGKVAETSSTSSSRCA